MCIVIHISTYVVSQHFKELISSDIRQTLPEWQIKHHWRRLYGHHVNTKSLKGCDKTGFEKGIYIFLMSFMYFKSPKM